MSPADFNSPRLFVAPPLLAGAILALDRNQANYLGNVLRLRPGDTVRVFNGRDGEWQAAIEGSRRAESLRVTGQTRPQDALPDVVYAFAPLKHARLDYMAQKAVEMGARALQPVVTRLTQARRVNLDRMRANVIEAAEQCGILSLAEVAAPVRLDAWLAGRDAGRLLVFCDEGAPLADPLADPLAALRAAGPAETGLDVVVGPEGGFTEEERAALLRQPRLARLSLGPRILRADTAAVAALALVQAVHGDWPH